MEQDKKEKATCLLLNLNAPHIITKLFELVYADEAQLAIQMGPDGSAMLLFAYNMQKKMLSTVLEVLDHCNDQRDIENVKEGLEHWCEGKSV